MNVHKMFTDQRLQPGVWHMEAVYLVYLFLATYITQLYLLQHGDIQSHSLQLLEWPDPCSLVSVAKRHSYLFSSTPSGMLDEENKSSELSIAQELSNRSDIKSSHINITINESSEVNKSCLPFNTTLNCSGVTYSGTSPRSQCMHWYLSTLQCKVWIIEDSNFCRYCMFMQCLNSLSGSWVKSREEMEMFNKCDLLPYWRELCEFSRPVFWHFPPNKATLRYLCGWHKRGNTDVRTAEGAILEMSTAIYMLALLPMKQNNCSLITDIFT